MSTSIWNAHFAAVLVVSLATQAGAASYNWFGGDNTLGGVGSWTTGSKAFGIGTTSRDFTWAAGSGTGMSGPADDIAVFGGNAPGRNRSYAVTLVGPTSVRGQRYLDANGLTFNTTGYIIGADTYSSQNVRYHTQLRLDSYTVGGVTVSPTVTTASGVSAEIGAVIAGSAGLTKKGEGSLTLSSNNLYSGTTTIGAGTLVLSRSGGTLANTSDVDVAGGTLSLNYDDTVRAVTLTSGKIVGSGTLSASSFMLRSGTVDAVLGGTGVAVVKETAGTVTLTAENTFSGTVAVNEGKLVLAHEAYPGALDNDRVSVNVNGGTLALTYNETVAGFTLTSGKVINETTTARRLTSNSRIEVKSGTVDAYLNGTNGLTKSTSGIVTLNGANTYTGTTQVEGGTLRIGRTGALASGSTVTIARGATLSNAGKIAGPVTVNAGGIVFNDGGTISNAVAVSGTFFGTGTVGAVTLNSGGVISAGSIGSIGTLNTGAETWNGGASLHYDFTATTGDLLAINGALKIGATGVGDSLFTVDLEYGAGSFVGAATGTTWTLAQASGGITGFDVAKFAINAGDLGNQYNGLFSLSTNGGNLLLTYTAAVPEPASYAFGLGLGTLAVVGYRRYRRRQN